jgi:2-dehydropantoate 2-reductase
MSPAIAAVADPQVAILGAGSIGCFVGGAWSAAGLDVTFVGREAVQREVAEHGITITDQAGARLHLPAPSVRFFTKPNALAKADVIALCVKSNATAAAAKEIGRHAKKAATIITFQNGVSNVEKLKSMLGRFEVLQGMVPFNVAHMGAGRWHKGVSGDLMAAKAQNTTAIAGRIGDRLGRLVLRDDMKAVAWGKLLINLNNAVNALSGRTLLEQLKERDYRRVVAASIVEALNVLEIAGIEPAQVGPIPPKLLPHAIGAPNLIFNNLLLRIQKIDANARSSMADDFAAGRETEIDYLNGEIVRLGRALGLKTPVNAAIVELVRQREAGVEHLWGPEDLRKYVLEGHRGVAIFGY